MTQSLGELREQIEAALRKRPLDLIVRNVRLVNVYLDRVVETDIGVKGDRIVTILPGASSEAESPVAQEVLDGQGLYAIPGLIDAHIHIESALLTPARLAEVIVPKGTTSLFIDPMEVANVAGLAGLEAFFEGSDRLPYRLYLQVPSRVPTAPGLETTGAELGREAVERILEWKQAVSLGELDPSKVLYLSDEHLQKVLAARARGKIANGHAIGLEGKELEAYAAAGLADDHECISIHQLEQRLALGMSVMIREGSSERNLADLMTEVVARALETRHLMFCTDDKHPSDIKREGHINYNINASIRLGLDPVRAIQMASLNAAQHFRLEHEIGSISPGRYADFLLCDSLDADEPRKVFVGGKLVAEDGRLIADVDQPHFPGWLKRTVHVGQGTAPDDFAVKVEGAKVRVRVIQIVPQQITNRLLESELVVSEGDVLPDLAEDVLKLAVVERHGKNGNLALGWAKGFGLKRGALASSVAHDHHNLLVIGTNNEDMAACVRALVKMHGGFVVVDAGRVLSGLSLPLAGLMSEASPNEIDRGLTDVRRAAASLGCPLDTPFMTLSFISLPSIPEAGISDLGLIDVRAHALTSVVLED